MAGVDTMKAHLLHTTDSSEANFGSSKKDMMRTINSVGSSSASITTLFFEKFEGKKIPGIHFEKRNGSVLQVLDSFRGLF